MLVLTRSIGQSLIIDNDIKVTVIAVTRNQVKIGVDAPASIEIHREEIFNRIQAEKKHEV